MIKNPFDGLYMHLNLEEKEWSGGYSTKCALCRIDLVYPAGYATTDEGYAPLILTYIDKAALDEDKYFCSYNCLEDWIDKFVVKFL